MSIHCPHFTKKKFLLLEIQHTNFLGKLSYPRKLPGYTPLFLNGGKTMYKNIEKQTALKLKDLVDYQDGQVVRKTLVQNSSVSMTLFSFD